MSVEPGSFRVRNENHNAHYRVAIEVAYTASASVDAIRSELNTAWATAVGELERRFYGTPNNRRRPSAANR